MGTASTVNVYFQFSQDMSYSGSTSPAQPMNATGTFFATLVGAPSNTTFHYRAVAVGDTTVYGNDMSFTTLALVPPTVVTNNASNVANATATLNGNLTSPGTANPVAVYFQWGINSTFTNTTANQFFSIPGAFHQDMMGLVANTTYIYRAVAVGDGTVNGGNVTFTTLPSITQATLNIAVTLEFRPSAPNSTWIIPAEVWLHANGTAWNATAVNDGALYHFNTNTTNTGIIQLMVPPGTYDVRVKGFTTLKNEFSNVVVGAPGPVNVNLGTLIEGDVNNDNVVDERDISTLIANFDSLSARNCDFNNDGVADEQDISILISKFDMVGADS
jgi:hypothetical protein